MKIAGDQQGTNKAEEFGLGITSIPRLARGSRTQCESLKLIQHCLVLGGAVIGGQLGPWPPRL